MPEFTTPATQTPFIGQVLPRNNYDLGAVISLAAAGAGTTTYRGYNTSGRGVIVVVDITAKTGTIDLVVSIYRRDKASNKRTLLLASASLTGIGTTTMKVHPTDVTDAANTAKKEFLGEEFEIEAVSGAGVTPAITATIVTCLVL